MTAKPTQILLFLCLAATLGLAYLWVDQNGQLRNCTWVVPAPIKSTIVATAIPVTTLTGGDISSLTAALDKPLFTPDRKPPAVIQVAAIAPPPPPDPMASVNLVGLLSGNSGGVMVRSEGKVRYINLTQKLGDWTLKSIEERSATFARADETRVIKLAYAPLNSIVMSPQASADAPLAPAPVSANAPGPMPDFARRQAEEAADRKRHMDSIVERFNQKKP